MTRRLGVLAVSMATLVVAACGGSDQSMMGSGTNGSGAGGSTVGLVSVSPAAGSAGVSATTGVTLRFSGAMGAGMEQYMDLHVGDLSGPEVAMGCSWSADRTLLACVPGAALAAHTTYAIHLGGGMMGAAGTPIDYTAGLGMGGQWITGTMMSGTHGGMPWGMMSGGWHNPNGSYGMVFTFTTA